MSLSDLVLYFVWTTDPVLLMLGSFLGGFVVGHVLGRVLSCGAVAVGVARRRGVA